MTQLTIGLVLPEVLGTYGDDGNALVLRQRARMRGIDAEIHPVSLGTPVPETLDAYCLGGGEDTAQILAAEHLISDGGLRRAADAGRPILAICAGLQVLGTSFRAAGRTVDGVGLLDATTSSLARRTIGEVASTPTGAGITAALDQPLTGFENHMGATILGPDASPLGTVTRGVGNCDAAGAAGTADPGAQTAAEGAVQGNVIATYMHGPALARNPQLADLILARALGVELAGLAPLDLDVVDRLRAERLR
ncbi:type 1 glutamine amidotransferase [Corynebacterium pygosceleis]|uniref:Lipid II isoglutaminyl synthase (glutamine-hydrolyzing) subunit GatD n=1 Tax=Corynebacterium pygosceleis TaxID=2800406 RepID=A0A9Q4GJN5_9CORY|nr:glutamine amidotransferase [Corynebacterium pygosceleis]MCK7637338.1 glutamine amidotransferase [Corynebacterium pygosceleis]MCK7675988.1 glutamine amidotransferase [Corynebacterium pygosceleis]MCL0119886.1 glutamine amidotransferase [Corynebacterium pygosceleis]MCX7445241.1 glutamine amidotransferase [Corynebacterium pygosceleis]MCX7468334.1 glutamine amidotransferase [Corynebacterium pygosceleis]